MGLKLVETYLNFFLGLSEGIGATGSEMAAVFHRGAVWFCTVWFALSCTLGVWIKSRFLPRGHVFLANVVFSLLLVTPWTLGFVAFLAALVFPAPVFLLFWVIYFWILPVLFDVLVFRILPFWRPLRRLYREWPNPPLNFIGSVLANVATHIPAFVAFVYGITDSLVIPK